MIIGSGSEIALLETLLNGNVGTVPILLGNGSSSAPSYSFSAYPSIGIYTNGTDVVSANSMVVNGKNIYGPDKTSSFFFDTAITGGSQAGIRTNYFYLRDATSYFMRAYWSSSLAQIVFGVRSEGNNNFIIADGAYAESSFGHGLQSNPTIFIHSATDPATDATQWISVTHDTSNAVISSGKGDVETDRVFRVTGSSAPEYPTTGAGFEVIFDTDGQVGSTTNGLGCATFQSYDRDAAAWRDLWFRGYNIQFDVNGVALLTLLTGKKLGINNTSPSYTLDVSGQTRIAGNMIHSHVHVSADYTMTANDYFVGVDTTGAAVTVTLPTAIEGATYIVKDEGGDAGTNNITVAGTIDGATNYVINTNYGKVQLYSDGTNWFTI